MSNFFLNTNLQYFSLVFLITNFISFYQKKSSAKYKFLIFFSIFIIIILSFAHLLPSFNNIEAIKNIRLSKNSSDLNLWLNFDKPLIAIFMLFFAYQVPRKL
jgi:hypothetical protein